MVTLCLCTCMYCNWIFVSVMKQSSKLCIMQHCVRFHVNSGVMMIANQYSFNHSVLHKYDPIREVPTRLNSVVDDFIIMIPIPWSHISAVFCELKFSCYTLTLGIQLFSWLSRSRSRYLICRPPQRSMMQMRMTS